VRLLTLDFETYYDKEYSLTKMSIEDYVYDPRFEVIGLGYEWDGDGNPQWIAGTNATLDFLAKVEWEDTALLCQNTMFDALILQRLEQRVLPIAFYFDTMLMARPTVLPFTSSTSLAKTAAHLGIGQKGTEVVHALGKHLHQFDAQELWRYGEYCRNDVLLTSRLFRRLKPSFCWDELRAIDSTLRMFLEPVLELDSTEIEATLENCRNEKRQLLQGLPEGVTEEDLMSNAKFAKVLKHYGVSPPTKVSPATGKSTYAFSKKDYDFLLLAGHENSVVRRLIRARLGIKSTIEESRAERLLHIARTYARLRVPLLYYGAHTGRYSGQEKLNLQNLPRASALRRAVMAARGSKLVVADFKQIEARINAWLAGEDRLLNSFKSDPYRAFAAQIYSKSEREVTKDERFIGKTCILGLGYGMGHKKFFTEMQLAGQEIDREEAQRVVGAYRTTYPGIRNQWYRCENLLTALAQGYKFDDDSRLLDTVKVVGQSLLLPNGLSLVYPKLQKTAEGWQYLSDRKWVKIYGAKLYENIVQALARIVMTEAMNRVPYRLALTVHDEMVFVVPEDEVEQAMEVIQREMTKAPAWAPGLPLELELKSAQRYGDAK